MSTEVRALRARVSMSMPWPYSNRKVMPVWRKQYKVRGWPWVSVKAMPASRITHLNQKFSTASAWSRFFSSGKNK